MKVKARIAMVLCAGLIGFVVGCRGKEGNMDEYQGDDALGGGGPDTWRVSSEFADSEAVPPTLPTGQKPEKIQDYATDVLVNAGCGADPPVMAVVKEHAEPAMCEHLIMTAARNDDGDFYEIGRLFVWVMVAPTLFELHWLNGPNDNFSWPVGKTDIFDAGDDEEPGTDIVACAMNECPEPAPTDCQPLMCAAAYVATVVNLEGSWSLGGETFEPGAGMSPVQDGRKFKDPDQGIEKGLVVGTNVSFQINDYGYEGTLAPDRNHLSGEVRALLPDTVIGSWFAVRE